jgi:hypothetical protein
VKTGAVGLPFDCKVAAVGACGFASGFGVSLGGLEEAIFLVLFLILIKIND